MSLSVWAPFEPSLDCLECPMGGFRGTLQNFHNFSITTDASVRWVTLAMWHNQALNWTKIKWLKRRMIGRLQSAVEEQWSFVFLSSFRIRVEMFYYVNPCKSLTDSVGWKPIKAWGWGRYSIIVAVLLQHHYLNIQRCCGKKGNSLTLPIFVWEPFFNVTSFLSASFPRFTAPPPNYV